MQPTGKPNLFTPDPTYSPGPIYPLYLNLIHPDLIYPRTKKTNHPFSYFASMNFSYGCTPHNWEYIFKTLQKNKMDFLPSVGPGYEDTAVRPWNRVHKKERKNGEYYAEYFQKAISLRPKVCLGCSR